jgi:hypothetical protein
MSWLGKEVRAVVDAFLVWVNPGCVRTHTHTHTHTHTKRANKLFEVSWCLSLVSKNVKLEQWHLKEMPRDPTEPMCSLLSCYSGRHQQTPQLVPWALWGSLINLGVLTSVFLSVFLCQLCSASGVPRNGSSYLVDISFSEWVLPIQSAVWFPWHFELMYLYCSVYFHSWQLAEFFVSWDKS